VFQAQSQSQSVQHSIDKLDWLKQNTLGEASLNPSQSPFTKRQISGKGLRYKINKGSKTANAKDIEANEISALRLKLLGMTKRSYFTRKEVGEFIHKTEQKAKQNARKAVEQYMKIME
jgi:hypothetical protein